MTERDAIQRLRQSGSLDELRRPGPPGGEPVLYWAERAPGFYLRATAISALLMAPLAFFLPGAFVAFLVFLSLSSWINARTFRFQIGPRTVTLRQSMLLPRIFVPLAEIAAVDTRTEAPGRFPGGTGASGALLLRLKNGRTLMVPGLKDVREAAHAVRTIQSGRARPGPGLHDDDETGGAVAAG